ncbi:FeoB-associated Cys-rich membrane protein [Thermoanaerobacterium thermosaccharolyticum]|uniref:FeoB-associated Cys-rich membrane protein n=1 Tax=Thermoanaerobacterium thermosaccharolyticum TaxID=1517 RepID=UPI003DA8DC41
MVVEIIITSAIVALAVFILYKNIKKSASGKCNCGNCSSSCPKFSAIKQKK